METAETAVISAAGLSIVGKCNAPGFYQKMRLEDNGVTPPEDRLPIAPAAAASIIEQEEGWSVVLQIVKYPHPALRHKSKPLRRVDAELKNIIREMFDLMYEQKGVGLAANQVALPYRLFVLNLEGDPQKGEEHVFLNPVISRRNGTIEAEEGCLSFPEIYAPVKRSEKIVLSAYDLSGREVHYELDGFFARGVQHEYDHLEGIQFIDRLSPAARMSIREAIEDLELEYEGDRRRGLIPGDAQIAASLAELEALRT